MAAASDASKATSIVCSVALTTARRGVIRTTGVGTATAPKALNAEIEADEDVNCDNSSNGFVVLVLLLLLPLLFQT